MAITLTTTSKSVTVKAVGGISWSSAKQRMKGQIPYAGGVTLYSDMGSVVLPFDQVIANGEITFSSAEELQEWVEANCFNIGGGGGEGATDWDDLPGKPAFIAAGATAAAARNAIGLGSAATRPAGDFELSGSALAAEQNAKDYADGLLAGIYRIKAPVATEAELPSTGNTIGDVRIVLADGNDWVWLGEEDGWYDIGNKVKVAWSSIEGKPTTFAPSAHTHDSDDISDATATGKSVLTAASQAAARSALGLGSASTQATSAFAAATHDHTANQISDASTIGRTILTSEDAAAARTALGLGSAATQESSAFAAAASLAGKSNNTIAVIGESGSTLTYGLSHAGLDKIVRTTGGGAKTHTVPPQSSVAWADGSVINLATPSSEVTITAGAGVNIIAPISAPWVVEPNTLATLTRLGTNEWVLAARFAE